MDEQIIQKIKEMGCLSKVSSKDLHYVYAHGEKIFRSLMPYRAKNGVFFSDRTFLFTSSHGLMRIGNSGSVKGKYGVRLQCNITDCNGSTECDVSVAIAAIDTKALERIATAIELRVVANCREKLKRFGIEIKDK